MNLDAISRKQFFALACVVVLALIALAYYFTRPAASQARADTGTSAASGRNAPFEHPDNVRRDDESAALIIDSTPIPLVSSATDSDKDTSQSPERGRNEMQPAPRVERAPLPLVLVDPEPEMKLNPAQLEAIRALRQEFIEAIGGYYHDPSDPEYARRWQEAAKMVDERVALALGSKTAMRLRDKAAAQAMQPSP